MMLRTGRSDQPLAHRGLMFHAHPLDRTQTKSRFEVLVLGPWKQFSCLYLRKHLVDFGVTMVFLLESGRVFSLSNFSTFSELESPLLLIQCRPASVASVLDLDVVPIRCPFLTSRICVALHTPLQLFFIAAPYTESGFLPRQEELALDS